MHQLGLICCGHYHETGQVRQKGNVERACVGRPIGPDQPCAIDGKAYGQALYRDIMHNLIIAALQKGGIDCAKRFHSASSQCR